MKDIIRDERTKGSRRAPAEAAKTNKRKRAYVRPELTTHDSKSILQAIGPAHGIYGFVPGSSTGGSL